jgi:excisionase family DNA binding protein
MARTKIVIDEPLAGGPDWLASYIGKPLRTVYAWRQRGIGPPSYKVGNSVRYRRSEVDQWLASLRDD